MGASRSGATDVLPIVPIAGITLEECAELARRVAKRLWEELGIPCYCYEAAAYKPEHVNLAACRAGEYEALPEKLASNRRSVLRLFMPTLLSVAPKKRLNGK